MARVEIVLGSKSDLAAVHDSKMLEVLGALGIDYSVSVISAHRNDEELREFCNQCVERGVQVYIAVAGMAAALPGAIAAKARRCPVLGVALDAGLGGLDALLSITRMPRGVPIACLGIGKAGLYNAAIFAAQLVAWGDGEVDDKLEEFIGQENKPAEIDVITSERSK